MKKILYGVCGIGSGHTQRQLPIIEHFAKNNKIVIFAYDTSFIFYSEHFKNNPNITVVQVAVTFYVGGKNGIDFVATKKLERNNLDYETINGLAFTTAANILGIPDLVISDYEPMSAKYAYEYNIPLITVDQQSKYLTGEFPAELNGQGYKDEVERLKLFFPTAKARIACSFFGITKKKDGLDVLIFPSILKTEILQMKNTYSEPKSILVYLSSQKEFVQSMQEIINTCSKIPDVNFHIFTNNLDSGQTPENISLHNYGDKDFYKILENCSGIVSTAGHTLLSEAMNLGIPVYAVPLPIYEQQMNADVVDKNHFGIKRDKITEEDLNYFTANLEKFKNSIVADTKILMRGDGTKQVIEYIERDII